MADDLHYTCLLVVLAYLSGSLPVSFLLAKRAGIDLRRVGSRVASPGNAWRTAGPTIGAIAIAGEVAKCALPLALTRLAGGSDQATILVGLAAMVGHDWPVFLGFDGGRGVSSGLVALLFVSPLWLTLALIPFGLLTVLLGDSAPAALITFALLPALGLALGVPLGLAVLSLGVMAVACLRRVTAPPVQGTEAIGGWRRTLNRLVFDRPVRDPDEWRHLLGG